ncbi:phosphotransferase family protein [Microbacterium aerolatum]|uniref:phosphotransferase family protein n=1 Tax=Microbacterium aerolatum TaxID=153731 RepID=UPI00384EFA16
MTHSDADVQMLASALDLDPGGVSILSREPLGTGSVTGMQMQGDERLLYYLDTSGLSVRAETGLVSVDGSRPTRIWQHPADPHLPALAPVAFENAADTLLGRLGLRAAGSPEMVADRPGRRAVLRVATGDHDVWLKVVRPSRVERIVRAGEAAASAGIPVPLVHGWSEKGLIVMAGADGRPAAEVEWEPRELLDQVDVLRTRLAQATWDHRSAGILGRVDWYATRGDDRVAAVLADAQRLLGASADEPQVAVVHGDLHFGQLFLGGEGITGVIDVDTLALGDIAEDPAAFLSHAIASALLTRGDGGDRVWALADLASQRWGTDTRVRGLALIHLAGHMIAAQERGEDDRVAGLGNAARALAAGIAPSGAAPKNALIDNFESP